MLKIVKLCAESQRRGRKKSNIQAFLKNFSRRIEKKKKKIEFCKVKDLREIEKKKRRRKKKNRFLPFI